MDREELVEALRQGPIMLTMNDGSQHRVDSLEFALVSDLSVHVLVKGSDGKMRARTLPLVTVCQVEQLEAA